MQSDRFTVGLDRRSLCIQRESIRRLHVGTRATVAYSGPTPNNWSARDIIPTKVMAHIQGPFRMRPSALL